MRLRNTFALLTLILAVACNSPVAEENTADTEAAAVENETSEEAAVAEPTLTMAWETDTVLITNESVLYNPEGDQIFVSNINGQPLDQDGNGFISILNRDGSIAELEWVTGLDAPKGMAVHDGVLYVTNIDELVAVDIASGSISNRYPVEGAQFLNDVTIGNGVVYFSDMNTGKLHALEEGTLKLVAEGLDGLNGLAYNSDEDHLYMLNANGLQRMDEDGSISDVNTTVTGGDGLILLEDDVYLATRWQGEIWLVKDGEATKLLDSKADELQTADIGYLPEENLVLVPRFFSDKVTAYTLSY